MRVAFVSSLGVKIKKSIFFSLVLCFVLVGCGCASDHVYNFKFKQTGINLTADIADYRKKVGVLPVLNSTCFADVQFDAAVELNFSDQILNRCPDILLINGTVVDCPNFLLFPPVDSYGELDCPELTKLGRKAGLAAVVFQNIRSISICRRNKGILCFKQNKPFLKVRVTATALDMLTGAILCRLTKEVGDIELDESTAKTFLSKDSVSSTIVKRYLRDVFLGIAHELGRMMGIAVSNQQWATTLVSVTNGEVTIPVGTDVGVSVGDLFAVFCGKRTIGGPGDQLYFVPGPKIGKVTVTHTENKSAIGVFDGAGLPVIGSVLTPANIE